MNSLLSFCAVSAVVIATPGPDTALTIRNTLVGGTAAGAQTAIGVACGQLVWASAASLGIAALLARSQVAFTTVKVAGAVYLGYLGLRALISALRGAAAEHALERHVEGPARRAALRQGLLSNLGNPKMAAFFTSLLPQFVPSGGGAITRSLVLGAIFALMTLSWLSLYAVAVHRAQRALTRPRVRRALDGLTGIALVALGVRIAAEHRA